MTKELDPKDVLAVQASVNDASSRVAGLWISFLTFAAYLSITVGSVTHEMMLKELAIKLPILSVELPVFAFFVIAPFFFLLFHFYLFLQILMLVRKINGYNKVLHERVADPDDRNAFRRRLDTFLIVQFMCGMERKKKELSDSLLRLVAWITLVGAPVLLLLQFQLVFLPYHSGFATWIHRGVIIADLLMIWAFWFALYSPDGEIVRVLNFCNDLFWRTHWTNVSCRRLFFPRSGQYGHGAIESPVFKCPRAPLQKAGRRRRA